MSFTFSLRKIISSSVGFLLLASWCGGQPRSNSGIDPTLEKQINAMVAIDDHAHPLLPPPGDKTDREFDALPVDHMEPETDPAAWRPDNPQLEDAWLHLWEFHATAPLDAAGQKDSTRRESALARARASITQHGCSIKRASARCSPIA